MTNDQLNYTCTFHKTRYFDYNASSVTFVVVFKYTYMYKCGDNILYNRSNKFIDIKINNVLIILKKKKKKKIFY